MTVNVILSIKQKVLNYIPLKPIDKGIMTNFKTNWGLVIEGRFRAGKLIKWRNSLPNHSSRLNINHKMLT